MEWVKVQLEVRPGNIAMTKEQIVALVQDELQAEVLEPLGAHFEDQVRQLTEDALQRFAEEASTMANTMLDQVEVTVMERPLTEEESSSLRTDDSARRQRIQQTEIVETHGMDSDIARRGITCKPRSTRAQSLPARLQSSSWQCA